MGIWDLKVGFFFKTALLVTANRAQIEAASPDLEKQGFFAVVFVCRNN